jgi:hypothetical protein
MLILLMELLTRTEYEIVRNGEQREEILYFDTAYLVPAVMHKFCLNETKCRRYQECIKESGETRVLFHCC